MPYRSPAIAVLALLPVAVHAQLSIVSDKIAIDAARGGSVLVKNQGKADAIAAPVLFTAPRPGGCGLTVKPAARTVPANSEAWLLLQIDSPLPCEAGAYAARLEVTAGGARKDVTIQVGGVPVPRSWKVTLYRVFPATSLYLDSNFSIPINVTPAARIVTEPELILPRENGSSVFGDGWLSVKLAAQPPVTAYAFRVAGGGQSGRYVADVTLPGAAGPTKLEVSVKDMVLWPLLVVVGSILLTLKVQRIMAVKRPALDWKRRVAGADEAMQRVQSASNAFGYVVTGVTAQRKQIDAGVAAFAAAVNPGTEVQSRIESAVAQLEQVPAAWSGFLTALQQLSAILSDLPAALTQAPPDAVLIGQPVPRVVADAQSLLAGEPLTVAEFRLVLARLSTVSALLCQVLPLAHQLSMYAALHGLTQSLQLEIDKTKSKLWRTATSDDLMRLMIPSGMDAIAEMVSVLPRQPLTMLAAPFPAVPPSIVTVELPAARAGQIAAEIADGDRRLAGLAVAIAVLFGLRDYYFDHAFGSLRDYSNLVIYGTGTKLAIDLVRTSVQALIARRTS